MKRILIFSIFLMSTLFFGCKEKTDIEFAKDFFEKLADGKTSVMDDIDWENLSGTGFDISGKIKGSSDNEETNNLKKSFIYLFSDSFKKSGLKMQNISNWIIEDTNNIRTIVSCEIGQDNFLYLVILKKDNTRKISSVMVTNCDLKLPSEFCSTINNDKISTIRISAFPSSLIDKHIKYKEDKDAELIKKKRFTKRIGISYFLESENLDVDLPYKSGKEIVFFDTNGYPKKSIYYDYFFYKKATEQEIKRHSIDTTPVVKLIDEKKGLYEETDYGYKYYYTLIDSLKYNFHKITRDNYTSFYKYDKNNNLLNIAFINEKGYSNGLISFFYDTLENVSRKLTCQINGSLNDTLFNTKYDSSGNIIECVRYYAPGTFDKNSYLFYKSNSQYDLKGNLTERMFSAIFTVVDFPEKITYTYNARNNIVKIYYYGWYGPLFYEGGVDTEYKFNNEGLLIENVDTGGDVIVITSMRKYTYE